MSRPNILFICADEHTRWALGCYGARQIKSPHLDSLARHGTRFSNAYTNSPLCVPARATLMTGEFVHKIRCWDNGHPYHGMPPGWAHRLRAAGYHTASIGKNHFRSTADDNGFDIEELPMHVRHGIGDLFGMLRKQAAPYPGAQAASGSINAVRGPAIMADAAGAGESNHTRFDRAITDTACNWLHGRKAGGAPWALYVSFVAPHFPLIAPEAFYNLYPHERISLPMHYAAAERPQHPVVQALTRIWNFDDFFDNGKILRARAGYYGLISFLDDNIGRILAALGKAREDTFIIYTSDHGEMLGNKGIWSTSALYEDSVGVPLILSGPGVAKGHVSETPVSHIDVMPTLLDVAGAGEGSGPGRSLLTMPHDPDRVVLGEYHAGGSITGCFMLRRGRWKYHYYVGHAPELFDLAADPHESIDLARDPAYTHILGECETALRSLVDPEAVDAMAFADQRDTLTRHGGAEAVRRRGHPGEHTLDRMLGTE